MQLFKILIVAAFAAANYNLRALAFNKFGGLSVDEISQFPYHVSLMINLGGLDGKICGGSLISNQWVLTAAHCVECAENITIRMGSTLLQSQGITQTTYEFIPHEEFDNYKNDIALIKLKKPIITGDSVNSISLPKSGDYLKSNTQVIVSGFGKNNSWVVPQHLKWYRVRTIPNDICKMYYGYDDLVTNSIICGMFYHGSSSSCGGDSGGPLIQIRNGSKVLVGIAAFGHQDCSVHAPVGFTRVESYLQWIHKHTNITL